MNNNSKIALLWLIREHKPISIRNIVKLLESSPNLLPQSIRSELLRNLSYSAAHATDDLFRLGLIETQEGVEFNDKVLLTISPRLTLLQSVFGISLTDTLKDQRIFTKAYPIFGEPFAGSKSNRWARVFVAMPFRDDLREVYTDHILKIANELAVSCKRGDDFFSTNSIINDVWSAIFHAEVCIVDCTGRNPNVFYELGIAHTLGRPSILIAQSMDDIPFDVRHLRVIIYQPTAHGLIEFETTLKKSLQVQLSAS